jgi:hypothetical protein
MELVQVVVSPLTALQFLVLLSIELQLAAGQA